MRQSAKDLNEYLFEQLDRLSNDDISQDELEKEIKRADAITKTAKTIIDNADVAIRAKKMFEEYGIEQEVNIPLLGEK